VTPKERAELFARTQAVWRALGETEPHWSVVTAEQFRSSNIAATLDDFFASGETHVGMFMRTLARNGIDASRLKTCMDFGAGVGRLSVALAKRFERVISVDVSASHLQLAREALAQRGIGNATTHVLKTIDAIDRLPACDFIVSVIVLQHNPPPVMRAVLAGLLGRVAPGGVALIQFPTYLPGGYRFDVRDYLAHGGRGMEMHALPQREAFAQIRAAGLEVLEVLEDGWTGYGVGARSNTFVLRRPA
jgi:2-polyprenyl-3-methyl-5-hydroxy-6-metoxy-1,4-benzoquinol methylase